MTLRAVMSPALRLVSDAETPSAAPSANEAAVARARRAIAAENHAASAMSVDDARWAFAVSVSQSLEGGRTAALPPVSRERLLKMATRMGLRPFDANLVIAIVQDGARSGEGSLAAPVAGRLMLVRPAADEGRAPVWPWLAAGATGLAGFAALVRWITGA